MNMTDEKSEEKKKETKTEQVVAKTEAVKDSIYKKDDVAFVIKPLHIDQAHRWAKWCNDRGYEKQHHKAFALAMDILEGRTNDLINSSKILEGIEKNVRAHDELIKLIIDKVDELDSKPEVEENLDGNEAARLELEKKKSKKKIKSENEGEKNDK